MNNALLSSKKLDGSGGRMKGLEAIHDECLEYELTIISIAEELTQRRQNAYKSGKAESFKDIIFLLESIKQEAEIYKEYLNELS